MGGGERGRFHLDLKEKKAFLYGVVRGYGGERNVESVGWARGSWNDVS